MSAPPYRVKAVYDYGSPHGDDLSFPNGQIITVTDEEDADWYYGEYTSDDGAKKEGLFPRNFVERYEPKTPPRPSRPTHHKQTGSMVNVPTQDAGVVPAFRAPAEVFDKNSDSVEEAPPSHQANPSEANAASMPPVADEPATAKDATPATALPLPARNQSTQNPLNLVQEPSTKAAAPPTKVKSPPPVDEQPGLSSFKDRIAAFNKSTAAPPTPVKPGGLGSRSSGFVKKQYVAPPPSRNAYIAPTNQQPPPAKVYRREEDPDVQEQVAAQSEEAPVPPMGQPRDAIEEGDENKPKPQSLKERIALLQQQQREQQNKRAEVVKKDKPKPPPKKRSEVPPVPPHEDDTTEHDRTVPASDSRVNSGLSEQGGPPAMSRMKSSESQAASIRSNKTRNSSEIMSEPRQDSVPPVPPPHVSDQLSDEGTPVAVEHGRTIVEEPEGETEAGGEAEEVEGEEDEEEEEEEEDPEVRRKMELRARMAKMSGGMGMPGMFGGMPPMGAQKPKPSGGSQSRASEENRSEHTKPPAQPVHVMALPGMAVPRPPKPQPEEGVDDEESGVMKETEPKSGHVTQGRAAEEVIDVEDLGQDNEQEETEEAPVVPTKAALSANSIPGPMPASELAAPSVPNTRPIPAPPTAARELPASSPSMPSRPRASPDGGSASPSVGNRRSMAVLPPIPQRVPAPANVAPQSPISAKSPSISRESTGMTSPPAPTRVDSVKRSSYMPPVPSIPATGAMDSTPYGRAAPPPPPGQTPARQILAEESDEGETEGRAEHEVPRGAPPPPPATYHVPPDDDSDAPEEDEVDEEDEDQFHHGGLPSIGPGLGRSLSQLKTDTTPRAAPPPPPAGAPRRQSRDLSHAPRAMPPLPPQAAPAQPRQPPRRMPTSPSTEDYDPFNYEANPRGNASPKLMPEVEAPRAVPPPMPEMRSPPRRESQLQPAAPMAQAPTMASPSSHMAPFTEALAPPAATRAPPRQSLDARPAAAMNRRSVDMPRPSGEHHDFIASEVDLAPNSFWWTHRRMPPPVFESRSDVAIEYDDSSSNGLTTKHVYILFMDYSQSVITASFDDEEPSQASLQQRHEPPPPRLRQDQLETAHGKLGARLAAAANSKLNTVEGDGSPHALVGELLRALPDALPAIGSRAYGATVYANLANATTQQRDEIRAGDIVSFRNSRMQGTRGAMKHKYAVELADHVAVVVDWDGTKKKIRAWEQGRESRKVRVESFKLGDLRSGEVKVWRVMSRDWVGWGQGGAGR